MSVAEQISRIQQDRNTIRNKLITLGLANGTDTLDDLAEAIDEIKNNGSISANVKEGETYTIPAGFHDGTGTVSGVAGGGNYKLQSRSVTPTKKAQVITPNEGNYGLSDVNVAPIPDAYQDVTAVTAAAGDVLTGKVIVDSNGTIVAGTMANNGSIKKTITATERTIKIDAGYHDGTGEVGVAINEPLSVTPSKEEQAFATFEGFYDTINVAPIPDAYQDVTEVTAGAADVLSGRKIVNKAGEVVTGTMANNGIREIALNKEDYPDGFVYIEGYFAPGSLVGVDADMDLGIITPTKEQIVKEQGFAHVVVKPIPDAYQDVTAVNATAAEVISGKKIVDSQGNVVTGTMANNGDVTASIDGITTTSVVIPAGYTSGGTISLTGDIEAQLAAI